MTTILGQFTNKINYNYVLKIIKKIIKIFLIVFKLKSKIQNDLMIHNIL